MRQEIRLGTTGANGRDGDDNRTAFTKINQMTEEIYRTGVVERGSNARGEYTKFADGTLMTWGAQIVNTPVPAGTGVSWAPHDASLQPLPFADAPITQLNICFVTGANGQGDQLYSCMQSYPSAGGRPVVIGVNMGVKPALSHPSFTYGTTPAGSYIVYFNCIGRWK